jgi:hypothetical protein
MASTISPELNHKQLSDVYNMIISESIMVKQKYNELLEKYNALFEENTKLQAMITDCSNSSPEVISYLQNKNAELIKALAEKTKEMADPIHKPPVHPVPHPMPPHFYPPPNQKDPGPPYSYPIPHPPTIPHPHPPPSVPKCDDCDDSSDKHLFHHHYRPWYGHWNYPPSYWNPYWRY